MVEKMPQAEDVERLFSWIKAPMVHYREFSPRTEVAEAVATWPAVHRAAVEAGVAEAGQPAPHGDTAARERAARERRVLPIPPPLSVREPERTAGEVDAAPMTPGRAEDHPAQFEAADFGAPAAPAIVRPAAVEQIEPAPTAGREFPRAAEQQAEPTFYPGRERDGLFAGEYRGSERARRSGAPIADRQDRSLDAVFSRLSGGRDRLPDPRVRARTTPGLGPVFGRLR